MAKIYDWGKKPAPGTAKAQEMDCICPVLDNNYGKGNNGKWWVTSGCPIHDPEGADDGDVLKPTE